MSVISPVQSHDREGSPMSKEEKLRWKGFVEKVGLGFESGVKSEGVMDDESGDDDRDVLRSKKDETRQDWLSMEVRVTH